MHPISRIEMIVSSAELPKITSKLDKLQAPGYTIFRHVSGKGAYGNVYDDDMSSIDNAYVLVFCPPEQTRSILEGLKPILNKFGGHCFVSEIMEVRSMNCIAKL